MKLYTLNTPCWTDYDAQNTRGESLIEKKLSDHFTFMNFNFMKYGLVDEVLIFLDKKRIERGIVDPVFETEFGKMTVLDKREIPNMGLKEKQFVYCWSGWSETSNLGKNFVIVNPMFNNIMYPSTITAEKHDYALIEGEPFSSTVPLGIPYDVFHYTTYDFSSLKKEDREHGEREYDWILVSSFDPRKRHIEFLNAIASNKNTRGLRGCIVGRNPDNKGKVNEGHYVLKGVREIIQHYDIDVDIFLNASQDKKRDLMLNSKVYVCPSALDNGPRSMIEAGQSGCILLSMPHIGSSSVIKTAVTGELTKNIDDMPKLLMNIIENREKYDISKVSEIVAPENVFPKLVEKIRSLHDGKFKQ